jgi:hypothetical protein
MRRLVKVQLPIDTVLARDTGRVYADKANLELLVYDRAHKHVFQGRDDTLRSFMLAADGGVGYVKAFVMADWDGTRWVVDYAAGFQPLAIW